MKITHCIFTMFTGGAQILLVDILNGLYPLNDVNLIIVNNEWEENILDRLHSNINVIKIRRPKGSRNPFYILKLNYILKKLNPDVVHCHEPNMSDLFFTPKFRTILTIHDVGRKVTSLKKYDEFVAISSSVAQDFKNRYRLDIPIVNNGINFESFRYRTNYELKTGTTIKLVQVSRLMHEKKGQDILLKALHEVTKQHFGSNFQLDIIGDGDSLNYLLTLTKELHLENNVTFLGNKERAWILENLKNYHMLIQPSLYEGFGLTVIEGIAAGIPVIASDIEGPAEILSKLNYNFLFKANNISSCGDKILEIGDLYLNRKIKDILFESRTRLNIEYSIENTVEGYNKIYRSVISQPDK